MRFCLFSVGPANHELAVNKLNCAGAPYHFTSDHDNDPVWRVIL
jgi:hypothetical protein